MIVFKENERLYPATWSYNAARITTALAAIVENAGGRVKYGKAAIISNRSISGTIIEKSERLTKIKAINSESGKEARTRAVEILEKEIEELKQIDNAPRRVTHTGYITFILDDVYYYYQMDDNPFFDFYYKKTPIKNGQYSKDACSTVDKKEWFFDCFFSWNCSDSDIKEAAQLIFNMLCLAPFSRIIRDERRQRVSNRYDGGWHYERIYKPERLKKIDF